MNLIEIIKSSFATLRMNGRRTFLTMFGIIVGISSVITIMSLGNGFKANTVDSLASNEEGNTSQEISYMPDSMEEEMDQEAIFSTVDITHIEGLPGVASAEVEDASEEMGTYIDYQAGDYESNAAVEFTEDASDLNVIVGRPLNQSDAAASKPYIMLEEAVAIEAFGTATDAVGDALTINGQLYTIVGVFTSDAMSFGLDMGSQLYLPTGNEGRVGQSDNMGQNLSLTVYFDAETDIQQTSEEITTYLNDEGTGVDKGEYMYFDTSELMKGIGDVLSTITYFISAVAGISLFIAGVGVMNMMYISVSERTKEIGIRRALGATKGNIQLQFLVEGILITTLGGVIGYIFGIGIAKMVSLLLPFDALVDWPTALISVIVSVTIGVVFAFFPAKSAANKNIIDILR
ncbi:ABC transporter permease [Aerococcus viridans]|uniref:ABC transporter permease n=1 Tax=Aerococcus viridans TaxID=1377 RepID=UPI003AA85FFE